MPGSTASFGSKVFSHVRYGFVLYLTKIAFPKVAYFPKINYHTQFEILTFVHTCVMLVLSMAENLKNWGMECNVVVWYPYQVSWQSVTSFIIYLGRQTNVMMPHLSRSMWNEIWNVLPSPVGNSWVLNAPSCYKHDIILYMFCSAQALLPASSTSAWQKAADILKIFGFPLQHKIYPLAVDYYLLIFELRKQRSEFPSNI
jgi:hypothetical protein